MDLLVGWYSGLYVTWLVQLTLSKKKIYMIDVKVLYEIVKRRA
jgi:hypothetical protein